MYQMDTPNNKFWISIVVFMCILGTMPTICTGQSHHITVEKFSNLSFGEVYSGQGTASLLLGDAGMCVFGITAKANKEILVTLNIPTHLTHTSSSNEIIPLEIQWAYANKNANNIQDAVIVSGTTAQFPVFMGNINPSGNIATAYLYIYGNLTVNDIQSGSYSEVISITVEYL